MSNHYLTNLLAIDLRIRGRSERTITEYTRIAGQFLETHPDVEALDRLTVGGWIYAADTPSKCRWRYLATNALCTALVEDGLLTSNPCHNVKMPVEPIRVQPALSDDEYDKLLGSCDNTRVGRRDRAILTFLDSTGVRVSEMAAVKVSDVDLDNYQVTIRQTKRDRTGVARERIGFLSPEAYKALVSWMHCRASITDDDTLWVRTNGQPLKANGIQQMLSRRGDKLLFIVSPHRFRRRFATNWQADGGSLTGLMSAGGWNSPAMPARYAAAGRTEIARADHERLYGTVRPMNKARDQRRRRPSSGPDRTGG